MPEGNTYDTKEEARNAVADYRIKGQKAEIVPRGGKYIVFLVKTKSGMSEAEAIAEGIKERDRERAIEDATELSEKEEIEKGIKKAERRRKIELATEISIDEEIKEATRKARRAAQLKEAAVKQPLEMEKAALIAKRELLQRRIDERRRSGFADPGIIIPVLDEDTRQIVQYELVTQAGEKIDDKLFLGIAAKERAERFKTKIESGLRSGLFEKQLAGATREFTSNVLAHTGRQINVKAGMKTSIPGQAPEPSAVIAWLPSKDIGSIGTTRPAIAKIGPVDTEEAKKTLPDKGLLIAKLETEKFDVDSKVKSGFTKIPILKKPVNVV